MFLKIMNGDPVSDGDKRSSHRLLANVAGIMFYRDHNGNALADVTFSDAPDMEIFTLEGNAYVLNEKGDTIDSFGGVLIAAAVPAEGGELVETDKVIKPAKASEPMADLMPQVGWMVFYHESNADGPNGSKNASWWGTNGTRRHPAVITRVWTDECVNLMVFFDAKGGAVRSSVCKLPPDVLSKGLRCTSGGWTGPID